MRIKKILLFCFFFIDLSLFYSCQVDAPDPDFHVYLSFGQSNMEGQGVIEDSDLEVDSRLLAMQVMDCPKVGYLKNQWREAIPPLCHCDTGLSPMDYFGRTMVKHLPNNIKVGVINVSVAGCDIRLFDKDLYQAYDSTYVEGWFLDRIAAYNGNPYQRLVEVAKRAQIDGVIKGILLHQGETNNTDEEWPNYVHKIYKDLLSELSLSARDVPLLAGEVLSLEGSCCLEMIPIINNLPSIVHSAHVISSKDCTAMDNSHFDSEGYREMGRRYAKKMLSLDLE